MSDVINSIFGRSNSGTPATGGYPPAESAPEVVATEEIEADAAETTEPDEDTATDVVTEDASVSEDAEAVDTETDESADDVEDEAVTEESDEAAADSVVEVPEEETERVATPVEAEAVVVEPVAAVEVVDEAERVVAAAARPAAGTRGATTIGDDVVVKIVYRVARKAEGVHELTSDDVEVAVDGDVATITISVVIDFGHAVKALAEKIRTDVIDAVEKFLGLDVEGVDVHIADIHFPDAD
ncbi:Asp23/Gls24 family envelope stress response protein [Amycolatopsis sp. WQ 127309]|uniref:Asp23/Gls24 family envelope stress response protein n=1 Tax=Amycolatopsis sp. WQ 127309 TaxID=2932773 RepID=UPI001FF6C9E4|nr:Asp23/Gls24 family envelope stress response protein [Amycolatopsis sp. WQ 127309]UOZ04112.1 Asp23/Gls24 family envelope stress response protein [Amycolatopsis sp. WQ 127309]